MKSRTRGFLSVLALSLLAPAAWAAPAGEGDPVILAKMHQINQQLREKGLNIALSSIELFTIGERRPPNRIFQTDVRWVPNDARRRADGTNLTYLVDVSDGATTSGLSAEQTEAAIDRAMGIWEQAKCMKKLPLLKRPDTGADADVIDALLGFGEEGDPFLADIVFAGWYPAALFDTLSPGSSHFVLAFTAVFSFIDPVTGLPTDINGDNYEDAAYGELYFNDHFGTPGGSRAGFPWGLDVNLPGIDTQGVALHESGHALGLGHFGPPPSAVMGAIFVGPRRALEPVDNAALCTLYSSWPNP